jgi:hypothetical protein
MQGDGVKSYKKVYISGPITGRANGNKEAFYRASIEIASRGSIPLDPHHICAHLPEGSKWVAYMRECIKAMMDADCLYMLSGWIRSRGARVEWLIAKLLGIPVFYAEERK